MGGFNLLSVKATRTPTTGENRQLVYSSLFFPRAEFLFYLFFTGQSSRCVGYTQPVWKRELLIETRFWPRFLSQSPRGFTCASRHPRSFAAPLLASLCLSISSFGRIITRCTFVFIVWIPFDGPKRGQVKCLIASGDDFDLNRNCTRKCFVLFLRMKVAEFLLATWPTVMHQWLSSVNPSICCWHRAPASFFFQIRPPSLSWQRIPLKKRTQKMRPNSLLHFLLLLPVIHPALTISKSCIHSAAGNPYSLRCTV